MKNYRLLAVDLDGTLLNDNKEVSAVNKEWIQKLDEKGIPVILTTGRGYERVEYIFKALEIKQPMVLVNGAEVWSDPATLLNRTLIHKEAIDRLNTIAAEYGASCWGYTTEKMIKGKDFGNDMLSHDWLKFGMKHTDISVIERIREEIEATLSIECTSSNPYNIECGPPGLTKWNGLMQIFDYLNVSSHEVVAVGDQMNDMSMIQAAGKGVAMGNAAGELKENADATTSTNNQAGVAEVIRTYFLNDEYGV